MAVVNAIAENNAGRPMDRLLLAKALQRTPASSEFRLLLSSSNKYGLTDGNEKSDYISPTALGLRVAKPINPAERQIAIREAAVTPELLKRILHFYNRGKLPQGTFFRNALERSFEVATEHTEELASLIHENARFAEFLEEIQGTSYVRMDNGDAVPAIHDEREKLVRDVGQRPRSDEERAAQIKETPSPQPPPRELPAEGSKPGHLFIAHGSHNQSFEELKQILAEFRIPYKVATNESRAGQPVSKPVADVMNSCSAAVFVLTKDEEYINKSTERVWRPNDRVIYELGAASVLFGRKIIMFVEDGIEFGTDLHDLERIAFAPGRLSTKALEFVRALIRQDCVRLEPT
jgi:hypothetical protein